MRTYIFVAFFSFLVVGDCLVCETCDGSTCFDRDRWLQESCPPSTQYCYRLSIEGKAFRRGCSDYPCSTLPGVEKNMECRTCSHDRCNNERDHYSSDHGSGLTWKKSASSSGFQLLLISPFLIRSFQHILS
ncbi:unnamed protein product [Caenorhabditis angaria]|uniref:Uncharacterized protein n=1 Tax=Caenorhabditis angaria TaxID=860376 RepID=A0A9P1N4Q5_9PELO|nr:unnamed protein product [Caenorhabditis angaria]